MRFLADESCDGAIVRALRNAGHDVVSAVESLRGEPDSVVMEAAHSAGVPLLTEDKDFGHLVFARREGTAGVILVRWPVQVRDEMVQRVLGVVHELGERLTRLFVVIEPGGVRIRPHPYA